LGLCFCISRTEVDTKRLENLQKCAQSRITSTREHFVKAFAVQTGVLGNGADTNGVCNVTQCQQNALLIILSQQCVDITDRNLSVLQFIL
jgi:hypothetical protein